jgi:hypothetical protein
MKVVVGHQPQYMPYIGILNKISKANIFIVVNHVQFERKSFQNRTYIKVNDQPILLSVPIYKKGNYDTVINKIEICYNSDWYKKHLRTIFLGYSKTRYFHKYNKILEGIFEKKHKMLADLTTELLVFFLKEFEIVEDIRYSSDLNIAGKKTDLLVSLTQAVNGDAYLSGNGAKSYFDENIFNKSGYIHMFNSFIHPKYPQLGKNFLEGMACIDLLFNCGKDGRKYIVCPEEFK